jgi:hypothetical protein
MGMWLDNDMTNTAVTAAKNAAAAHLATRTTDELFEMLDLSDDRVISAWIAEVIEARHPEVTPVMDAWADDLDATETYAEALRRAVG